MAVVGLDFGTTNVRIAIWDPDQAGLPQQCMIGAGNASTMPSVVAFQRQPGGAVSVVVGEDADALIDGPNTLVVRNIKRWALTNDPYVRWQLEAQGTAWPTWWNPQTRCVNVWDQQIPVSEVIHRILSEAIRRAGLGELAGWRAGCPVHAGLTFRKELAHLLSQFGGENKITWVVEEPILFLVLAYRIGALKPGSYLVYDLGGGSFDCALAEVKPDGQAVHLTIYAADGNPLLGGADIDELLKRALGYDGPPHLLRIAKEQLSPKGPPQTLPGGIALTWDHLEGALLEGNFVNKTLQVMMYVYHTAKLLWNRGDEADPAGEVIWRNSQSGAIRTVWQLRLDDMARDLDGVILFGGPTKSPFFQQQLGVRFGVDKVIAAADLIPGLPDPELVGLSMGACYLLGGGFAPLYVNRLPAKVTLREVNTGRQVEYEPYHHPTPPYSPFQPLVSVPLIRKLDSPPEYELAVTDADGEVLENRLVSGYFEEYPGLPAFSLRLVIDRYGRIWIEKTAGGKLSLSERVLIMEEPPWQTETQGQALRRLWEEQRKFELAESERVHINLTKNPFGWQSTTG
jgi:hypothetical protein